MPVIWAFYCLHFYTCTSMLIGFSFCLWEYVGRRGEGFFARRWGKGGSKVLWSNKIFCLCVCVRVRARQGVGPGPRPYSWESWPADLAARPGPHQPSQRWDHLPLCSPFVFLLFFWFCSFLLCERHKRPWLDAPSANPPWTILKSL